MYRVVLIESVNEPWWFFDDWRSEVANERDFDDFYDALKFYKSKWVEFAGDYDEFDSRDTLMTAFWNHGDTVFCDECDEENQFFHSLALLQEDWTGIPDDMRRWAYAKRTSVVEKTCAYMDWNEDKSA